MPSKNERGKYKTMRIEMWGALKINNILIGLIYYILSGELGYHRVFAALDKFNPIDLTPLLEEKTFRVMLIITRMTERRFLTGLPRGYFFWGEGAAIHTQATIKPCRRPLRETESHVRLKHKLIQNIAPFWKTFVTRKWVPFLSGGCIITFKFHYYE